MVSFNPVFSKNRQNSTVFIKYDGTRDSPEKYGAFYDKDEYENALFEHSR